MSVAAGGNVSRIVLAGLAILLVAGLAVDLEPYIGGATKTKAGFATVAVTILLLATGAVSTLWSIAIFFALALVTAAAPPMVLASAFWSNAIMLMFGGLVMGAAAERSGLGRYIAQGLMRRFLGSYPRLLVGILLGTGALSFLVPSTMGRLAITIPVVLATLKEAGYAHGSNGYIAAILVTVAGNFMTSYGILPSNLVQIITFGAAEAAFGAQITYAEYFLLTAPVFSLLKGLTFILVTLWVFPSSPPAPPTSEDAPAILTPAARRLGIVLGITVTLWATDVLHGLKPGWVALGAGLACMLPPVSIMSPREAFDRNRIIAILSVPMMLGIASVMTHSGAGRAIIDAITAGIPLAGQSQAYGFAVIAVLSSLVAILATTVGCIAVMIPLVGEVATATGLSPRIGSIALLNGLQILFFHYEAAPVLVGLLMGKVSARSALRLLVPLALVGLLVVLPAHILWLKLLGAMS